MRPYSSYLFILLSNMYCSATQFFNNSFFLSFCLFITKDGDYFIKYSDCGTFLCSFFVFIDLSNKISTNICLFYKSISANWWNIYFSFIYIFYVYSTYCTNSLIDFRLLLLIRQQFLLCLYLSHNCLNDYLYITVGTIFLQCNEINTLELSQLFYCIFSICII